MSDKMIFLTDTNIKPKIIKYGQELIESKKSSLEKLYCVNTYPQKQEEIKQFIINLIEKSQELLNKNNDIDSIFYNYKKLEKIVNCFVDKNLDFLTAECKKIIENILYISTSLGIILSGILQIENSRLIHDPSQSVNIAYDGTDRIATSIEKYIDFLPQQILLEIKDILENVYDNAEKKYREYIDYFHEKKQKKVFFINNLISIKRVCNSTIFLIEKHLAKKEIIDLYPNKESFDYLKKQQEKFNEIDKTLLEKYKGQFIYFENGKILDSDFTEEKLVQRVMDNVGYRSVFITKV